MALHYAHDHTYIVVTIYSARYNECTIATESCEVYWWQKHVQCERTRSLNLFFDTVAQANPPVLGLLGCGCSVASEPVAEVIHHWNISQVSPGLTSSANLGCNMCIFLRMCILILAFELCDLIVLYKQSHIMSSVLNDN